MNVDSSRVLETERKTVVVTPKMLSEGQRVLDIGGGGEGVISKIYKEKVVAIDTRLEELEEIGETGSLKIVMDATKLAFADNQFDLATAFFSFMYMDSVEIGKAIGEVYRVLKANASFEIWDIEMPSALDVEQDIFVAQLEIMIGQHSIRTGYGVRVRSERHSADRLSSLLTEKGFILAKSCLNENGTFYLEALKFNA